MEAGNRERQRLECTHLEHGFPFASVGVLLPDVVTFTLSEPMLVVAETVEGIAGTMQKGSESGAGKPNPPAKNP